MKSNVNDNQQYKKTILIADSCVGGLGVLTQVQKWSGGYSIEYLADYEKNPFGLKTREEIRNIVESWFRNLVKPKEVCLVIIGCNTASIAVHDSLQEISSNYGVPVISMVDGLKACLADNSKFITNKSVGIMATKYSIESGTYFTLVDNYNPCQIVNIVGTNSEHCVATGRYLTSKCKPLIEDDLKGCMVENLETVILGCTCLPLISKKIAGVIGRSIVFLNPAEYVSQIARQILKVNEEIFNNDIHILTTSSKKKTLESIHNTTRNLIGDNIKVSCIEIER